MLNIKKVSEIIARIIMINCMAHLVLTLAAIPMVINAKYITNSSALFTGFLKRTIDIAPIIPRDKAIFP